MDVDTEIRAKIYQTLNSELQIDVFSRVVHKVKGLQVFTDSQIANSSSPYIIIEGMNRERIESSKDDFIFSYTCPITIAINYQYAGGGQSNLNIIENDIIDALLKENFRSENILTYKPFIESSNEQEGLIKNGILYTKTLNINIKAEL